jgi:SAM-dependent methyltransferase
MRILALLLSLFLCVFLSACSGTSIVGLNLEPPTKSNSSEIYEYRQLHDLDGIGKFYMGREIAQAMGHSGAGWLERPTREEEERPSALVAALDLPPDAIVADIGAGTGYLAFRISQRLPQGKVLAVDIQPEMLEIINFFKQEDHIENVETVLGSETDPQLPPNQVDLALMVDAYHEFAYPKEMMEGIVRSLKPGGQVVLVEYRGENPLIFIKALHKMTEEQVCRELEATGLVWQETQEFLPQQHMLVFRKPGTTA